MIANARARPTTHHRASDSAAVAARQARYRQQQQQQAAQQAAQQQQQQQQQAAAATVPVPAPAPQPQSQPQMDDDFGLGGTDDGSGTTANGTSGSGAAAGASSSSGGGGSGGGSNSGGNGRRPPRFSWTSQFEATFFRSLCESVQLGLRDQHSFKSEAWDRAIAALREKHGAYPSKSHLVNKSDNARKKFRLWRGLREDPEFLYNPATRTVTASEAAWKQHIDVSSPSERRAAVDI